MKDDALVVPDNTENCVACYGKGTRHDFTTGTEVKCTRCHGTGKAKK